MRAVSLRPPWGNAIAWWGKDIENRTKLCPSKDMIGARFAIHQGKRWTDEEREHATQLATLLGAKYRVPLAPEGYPQGIVATARCAGFIDARLEGRVSDAGHHVEWNSLSATPMDIPPEGWEDAVDTGPPDITMHSATVIGAASQDESREWTRKAINSEWWMGPIGWLLADVKQVHPPVLCGGHQGIYNLGPRELDEVRMCGAAHSLLDG